MIPALNRAGLSAISRRCSTVERGVHEKFAGRREAAKNRVLRRRICFTAGHRTGNNQPPVDLAVPERYIKKILNARVYNVATETPLEALGLLSERLANRVLL